MNLFFIVSNLKVHPFLLGDAPPKGFEILTWDAQTYTLGTLWRLPFNNFEDAGYTKLGIHKVHGQLWKTEDTSQIETLSDYLGKTTGLCYPTEVEVTIELNDLEKEKLNATVFALNNIKSEYEIIPDGRWRF